MEHLLRLSGIYPVARLQLGMILTSPTGLLGDDDNGATDLGTLERKLAEKTAQSRQTSQAAASNPTSPSQAASAQDGNNSTPRSSLASPLPEAPRDNSGEKRASIAPEKVDKEETEQEVSALSEMMCSLVTNNNGETRYIGKSLTCRPWVDGVTANLSKGHLPASQSFLPRASSGSMRRWVTTHSSR